MLITVVLWHICAIDARLVRAAASKNALLFSSKEATSLQTGQGWPSYEGRLKLRVGEKLILLASVLEVMLEKATKYQLAELKPEDFAVIPRLNVAVAKTKVRIAGNRVLTNINWFEAKLLIQNLGSDYFMLTSSQWSKARDHLTRVSPNVEIDFITGENEWVDSLLAFPSEDGKYSARLQIPTTKKEKVPLLIEQSRVEMVQYQAKIEKYYYNTYNITKGKVTEVPKLPSFYGYIEKWDDDLGLPTKVGSDYSKSVNGSIFAVSTNYDCDEGLRALVCSKDRKADPHNPCRWFNLEAGIQPSLASPNISFRLAKHIRKQP